VVGDLARWGCCVVRALCSPPLSAALNATKKRHVPTLNPPIDGCDMARPAVGTAFLSPLSYSTILLSPFADNFLPPVTLLGRQRKWHCPDCPLQAQLRIFAANVAGYFFLLISSIDLK